MVCTLAPVSPPPADGSSCPSGAAFTFDVPSVRDVAPVEALTGDRYLHWVVNGESDASVSCRVAATGSGEFALAGRIASGVKALEIADGFVSQGSGSTGTARITVIDAQQLSSTLADCTIEVVSHATLQIKPGSVWAHFSCPSLKHAPGEACGAQGFFVLENCAQN